MTNLDWHSQCQIQTGTVNDIIKGLAPRRLNMELNKLKKEITKDTKFRFMTVAPSLGRAPARHTRVRNRLRIGFVRIHSDELIERSCVFHIFQRFPCSISRGITFPVNKEFSSSMGESRV